MPGFLCVLYIQLINFFKQPYYFLCIVSEAQRAIFTQQEELGFEPGQPFSRTYFLNHYAKSPHRFV